MDLDVPRKSLKKKGGLVPEPSRKPPPQLHIALYQWFLVDTFDLIDKTVLVVRKNIHILESTPEIALVADYIQRYGFRLIGREVRREGSMTGRRAEVSTYQAEHPDDSLKIAN